MAAYRNVNLPTRLPQTDVYFCLERKPSEISDARAGLERVRRYFSSLMGRRIASQVHQQVSRLLRANYLNKEPAWFQAVLDNPPLVLPPKAAPVRTAYDKKPTRKDKKYSARPVPIYYLEDDIRRQFFADHPFEAFRPATLVEADTVGPSNPVTGPEWRRLRQRGRNPTPEE